MPRWEPSFIAVGVLLGESVDAMRGALGVPVPLDAARLLAGLEAKPREVRARALAHVLSEVAVGLNDARVA